MKKLGQPESEHKFNTESGLSEQEKEKIRELWKKHSRVGEVVEAIKKPWGQVIKFLKGEPNSGEANWPSNEDLEEMDQLGMSPEAYYKHKDELEKGEK